MKRPVSTKPHIYFGGGRWHCFVGPFDGCTADSPVMAYYAWWVRAVMQMV
jgi:hypothetical protein